MVFYRQGRERGIPDEDHRERRKEMNGNDTGREISFDIVEEIGLLTTYTTGWSKELNLVSWNGGAPKYDIRDWSPDHLRMSRGVTLHEKEMRFILDMMRNRNRRQSYDSRRERETGQWEADEDTALEAGIEAEEKVV